VTGKGRETREIAQADVDRVIEAARAVVIPMDRQVLHVIPQSYIVDDQKGIRNPLDMIGVRLEAEVHIITGSVTSAQNLIKCVNRAGFRVEDLLLQSLAAARSTLTHEEREIGVALVDLGGGTTDILVFQEGSPYFTTTIPVGGSQVTSDIPTLNGGSFETAERIKLEAGCCWAPMVEQGEEILVPGVGGRAPLAIPRSQILSIIQPRMEELFRMVLDKIDRLALSRPLGGGVVLTGGGSQLAGVAELASRVLRMPVRVGVPMSVGGLVEEYRSPSYSTAVGLVLQGADRQAERGGSEPRPREKGKVQGGQSPLFGKLTDWLKKEFF